MLCYVMIWYVRRVSQLRKRPHAPSNGCQGKNRKEVRKKPARARKSGTCAKEILVEKLEASKKPRGQKEDSKKPRGQQEANQQIGGLS